MRCNECKYWQPLTEGMHGKVNICTHKRVGEHTLRRRQIFCNNRFFEKDEEKTSNSNRK